MTPLEEAKDAMDKARSPDWDSENEYCLQYAQAAALVSIAESLEKLASKNSKETSDPK